MQHTVLDRSQHISIMALSWVRSPKSGGDEAGRGRLIAARILILSFLNLYAQASVTLYNWLLREDLSLETDHPVPFLPSTSWSHRI
ncbi:hypothetical protein EJ02DRAFT_228057 [Clathrospora elynae]|uniref:Uncharacterized protein n=1 Tax=Clathrospora elynae TaxID=706981 RepID=A0A6A5SU25_9PLEO|nr:hypothetical protein EJ02DRAFT_228057 [Clathrospora elynae]